MARKVGGEEVIVTVLSDLHGEIAAFDKTLPGGDLLILAGDITCARFFPTHRTDAAARSMRKIRLWSECAKYRRVFYVMGNHEPYQFDIAETVATLRAFLAVVVPNVRILDDEAETFDGVRFIGGTLWTDMDRENPLAMMTAQQGMNDYATITDGGTRLTPAMTVARHKRTVAFLERELTATGPKVVITHHPPSLLSLNREHSGNNLDAAFASNLHELIEGARDLRYWVHGHTHRSVAYTLPDNETVIFANQRGYADCEPAAKLFDPARGFEIAA
jgi:Icc-related predicted phosphoesterase